MTFRTRLPTKHYENQEYFLRKTLRPSTHLARVNALDVYNASTDFIEDALFTKPKEYITSYKREMLEIARRAMPFMDSTCLESLRKRLEQVYRNEKENPLIRTIAKHLI